MAKDKIRKQDALDYHQLGTPGKIEVIPTKPTNTQRDLALAYSPGVAVPCEAIAANKEDVYKYTAKGNLVAVISNGTAVLGLGDIGPEASKPVMEGKGLLFKIFAGIDVFDIEVDATDVDEFCKVVKALEPTFGGINLEDIKAPDCFEIEKRLKEEMNIPVMHDDQHGTAIISGAALLNALEIAEKKIEDVKIVVSGAGASAITCVKLFIDLGAKKENVIICDSRGVIRADRDNLSGNKKEFATALDFHQLEDAIQDADVFLGLSKGDLMTPDMLLKMNNNPIVFALANPDPEIAYDLAIDTREDIIMATGRSDHPNQVNNVLGFPFIFRGALDVRATAINEEMKLAAVKAIARLTKEQVPDAVLKAYHKDKMSFGRDYIIPKPMDPRLLTTVAPAVAKAAMDSGVAQFEIDDWEAYKEELEKRMGKEDYVIRSLMNKARQKPKRIVMPEAHDPRILKAAQIVSDEGLAKPVLLGKISLIRKLAADMKIDIDGIEIIDPRSEGNKENREKYAQMFYDIRKRKGVNEFEARDAMNRRNYYGAMMIENSDADGLVTGLSRQFSETLRPMLQIIGGEDGNRVSSMEVLLTKKGPLFLADTAIYRDPTAEQLAEITLQVSATVQREFDIEPHVALLSYSNFGSTEGKEPRKMREVLRLVKEAKPDLVIDGEIQPTFALNPETLKAQFPFTELIDNNVNVLIFPNLSAANISYKMAQEIGGVEGFGPVLLGMNRPVQLLDMSSDVQDIVNMVTMTVVDAQ
ncbi:NADP-dependent malic enzyme [Sediminitomix flava]|uniref:Allosteric NADP-dependent malic enzyme n=1 Tax=Sediminitomix flava TaxID=379075 RepID=A0A315ZEC5_SEDFL|nr:NADP-dependent malic enzyme [Sediminitomix flava]PWJ43084.1 allosteric NADP-dependent malic enzyme [Sediminitomix flava]